LNWSGRRGHQLLDLGHERGGEGLQALAIHDVTGLHVDRGAVVEVGSITALRNDHRQACTLAPQAVAAEEHDVSAPPVLHEVVVLEGHAGVRNMPHGGHERVRQELGLEGKPADELVEVTDGLREPGVAVAIDVCSAVWVGHEVAS